MSDDSSKDERKAKGRKELDEFMEHSAELREGLLSEQRAHKAERLRKEAETSTHQREFLKEEERAERRRGQEKEKFKKRKKERAKAVAEMK